MTEQQTDPDRGRIRVNLASAVVRGKGIVLFGRSFVIPRGKWRLTWSLAGIPPELRNQVRFTSTGITAGAVSPSDARVQISWVDRGSPTQDHLEWEVDVDNAVSEMATLDYEINVESPAGPVPVVVVHHDPSVIFDPDPPTIDV